MARAGEIACNLVEAGYDVKDRNHELRRHLHHYASGCAQPLELAQQRASAVGN